MVLRGFFCPFIPFLFETIFILFKNLCSAAVLEELAGRLGRPAQKERFCQDFVNLLSFYISPREDLIHLQQRVRGVPNVVCASLYREMIASYTRRELVPVSSSFAQPPSGKSGQVA